jgi:hypothetical protein
MGAMSITGIKNAGVFQCPNCKETINTAMQECSFCHTPVDPIAADVAAEAMARINQACSDASYLKIAAINAVICFGLFAIGIPLVGWVAAVAFFAVPLMATRWRARTAAVKTDDADFCRAKRFVNIIFWACVAVPLCWPGLLVAILVVSIWHPWDRQ